MGGYTKTNLRSDVENSAPKFDMPAELDARFARRPIGGKALGLSLMKLAPGFRIPFGHKHEGQEEVYVVVRGSARIKVEDEVVELVEWDAIRFAKNRDGWLISGFPGSLTPSSNKGRTAGRRSWPARRA